MLVSECQRVMLAYTNISAIDFDTHLDNENSYANPPGLFEMLNTARVVLGYISDWLLVGGGSMVVVLLCGGLEISFGCSTTIRLQLTRIIIGARCSLLSV